MDEHDIRYMFDVSNDTKYSVCHDFIVKYIASPKKISIKKITEQNNLIVDEDYIVNLNNEYTFTLNAFKICIINYKMKFVRQFIDIENNIVSNRIKTYYDKINELNIQIKKMEDITNDDSIISTSNSDKYNECNINTSSNIITTSIDNNQVVPMLKDISLDISKLNEKIDLFMNKVNKIEKQSDINSKKINLF